MYRDPIVEEVRKYREANAAKFGFDVRKIVEDAVRRQANSGHRVVDFSKETASARRRRTTRSSRARAAVRGEIAAKHYRRFVTLSKTGT